MHSRARLAFDEFTPRSGDRRALPTLLERPFPWVLTSGIVLCLGIIVSASSTTDSTWWVVYFSHLGTFGDLSSHVFNVGLILCGAIVAFSAIPVRLFIERALEAGAIADVRTRHVIPPTRHRWATGGVTTLIIGIIAMITGVINLTLFEVIAFGTILTWAQLIQAALAQIAAQRAAGRPGGGSCTRHRPARRRARETAGRSVRRVRGGQRCTDPGEDLRQRLLHER